MTWANNIIKSFFIFKVLLVLQFLWYLLAASMIPITQDEAYYFAWGQRLALGYFDHPPAIAFITYLSSFFREVYLR